MRIVYGSKSLHKIRVPTITMIIPACQAELSLLPRAVKAIAAQTDAAMA
jgi:hypothetical protein